MREKPKKNKKKATVRVSESVQFYNEIGKIYIGCGIASLLLLGFISLLPQDYEKYNIPLFFGLWALISVLLIVIGITPILLGRYSKKYQMWVEKEVRSFNRKNDERTLKYLEKDMKEQSVMFCVQWPLRRRILFFTIGIMGVIIGLLPAFLLISEVLTVNVSSFINSVIHIIYIIGGTYLLHESLFRIRVYENGIIRSRILFVERSYRITDIQKIVRKRRLSEEVYQVHLKSFLPSCIVTEGMENGERFYNYAIEHGVKKSESY